MPSGFASLDTGFPDLSGYESTEKKLKALMDYLFQLLEQLRYTLHNLGTENMNEESLKDIINMTAKAIDLTGYVTFHSLATPGETVIDGGNIITNSIHLVKLGDDVTGSFGDANPAYIKNTYIDFRQVQSPAVYAGDFYGGKYHDAGGASTLDITSASTWWRLLFGVSSGSGLADTSFAIDADPIDGSAKLYLAGKHVMSMAFSANDNELNLEVPLWLPTALRLGNSGTNWGSTLPGGGTSAPNWSAAEKSANIGRVFFMI